MDSATAKELLEALIQEIGREEFIAVLKAAALWGLAGAALGLTFGFGAYRGFRRLRWYAATSTAGRWAQRSAGVLTTLACITLFALAGAWEGVRRQCEPVVLRSRLGTEGLPLIANYVTEALAWVELAFERDRPTDDAAADAQFAAFRNGTREYNPAAILEGGAKLRHEVFQTLLNELEADILENSPALQGTFARDLVHRAIQELGPALLDRKLDEELERRHLAPLRNALRDRLIAAAARTGDPATISHRDLTDFVVREALVPAVVAPVRKFARQQQILCVVVALLCCLTPPPIFRLCRKTPEPAPAGP
jgi:hypothetical protein